MSVSLVALDGLQSGHRAVPPVIENSTSTRLSETMGVQPTSGRSSAWHPRRPVQRQGPLPTEACNEAMRKSEMESCFAANDMSRPFRVLKAGLLGNQPMRCLTSRGYKRVTAV